ncbi:hypothetical protein [Chryseobacterium ureilyticum]|nr:hypothetical protein [Chryseobacterium ureilyticum]
MAFNFNAQSIVDIKNYGAKGDGITDDTKAFYAAIQDNAEKKNIIDGKNRTYRILTSIDLTISYANLKNFNFILGEDYKDQGRFVLKSPNVILENIFIDGGRNTYKKGLENWYTLGKENNIPSIYPQTPDVFYIIGLEETAKYVITNLKMINIHAGSCITIVTHGTVNMDNLYFKNISNKTFDIYHSNDEGKNALGQTTIGYAYAENVGQLPDYILLDKKKRSTKDGVFMAQSSFNFVVSYGNFYADKLEVENYGSTAVTPDRNSFFKAKDIIIRNNLNKSYSNNPSGALWFEACQKVEVENVDIDISKRNFNDYRFDNSAIYIYGYNSNIQINNVKINANDKTLNKGIKGAFKGKNFVNIDQVDLTGKFRDKSIFFGDLDSSADISLNFKTLNVNANDVLFYNVKKINISNFQKNNLNDVSFSLTRPDLKKVAQYHIKKTNLKEVKADKSVLVNLPPNTIKINP